MPPVSDYSFTIMGSSSALPMLNTDVLDIVCGLLSDQKEGDKNSASLVALSTTDKRTRSVAIRHLFKQLKLHFVNNQPYKRGLARLKTWNPEFAPFVKSIDITFACATHAFAHEEDHGAEEALTQLADVLGTLTRLRKIACSVDDAKYEHRLEKALCTRHVQLFLLVEEAHGPSSHIFVRFCPNARYISNLNRSTFYISEERVRNLYNVIHHAPKLDCLEITSSWSTSTLKEVRNAAPNVSRLFLRGVLLRDKSEPLDIYRLIPIFASFPALKILGVMSLSRLAVGYNPPRCGNVYMGSQGAQLRERLRRQSHRLTESIATAAFNACNQLVELWIGSYTRALAERRGGTVINIEYDFRALQSEVLGTKASDL
ncbi:hypothetical protein BDZ89DRAFT_1060897 [Hymenopellis radicata]|nr:hypothetical protein BDZ89DRAFT_1060897 [Hymenopellis radicata]